MSTSTIPQGRNLSTPRASEPPLEHTARGPTDQGRAAAHEESIWVAGKPPGTRRVQLQLKRATPQRVGVLARTAGSS